MLRPQARSNAIEGCVTSDGQPTIRLEIAGGVWEAVIDTGFNGDLEPPDLLRESLTPVFLFRSQWLLAGGIRVDEDVFRVSLAFDGRAIETEATFAPGTTVLFGTNLLRDYRLDSHEAFGSRATSIQLSRIDSLVSEHPGSPRPVAVVCHRYVSWRPSALGEKGWG